MPNHLTNENSPYLLQHANNPVDWYPWGTKALEKARAEDKPIFLSIGYAACHWCHVMAHESFEDPDIAAILNSSFVSIKVDREERPDLDNIYMQAVVALTGQGGWPLSIFLTPTGEPFYGGTYFPPVRRHNLPAFREVLLSVARVWEKDHDQIIQSGADITRHLQSSILSPEVDSIPLQPETLDQAAFALAQSYDWQHGGWDHAPKFPQPMAIEFLLRRAARNDQLALDIASHALKAMAQGGMYDVVGGGFARYSTDDHWLVPHFEKMLYDNAQLALAYLHAYLLVIEHPDSSHHQSNLASVFRHTCESTLDFVIREMTHPAGGFYSSLDADSEGEEGKYYIWTLDEIRTALRDDADANFFIAAYHLTDDGNFEGRSVLQRALDDAELATQFGMNEAEIPHYLSDLHARLLDFRSHRTRPATDDKVLTAWNALMLRTFAESGRYLNRPDYIQMAMRNADFLLTSLMPQDKLLRSWRQGQARHPAYLEDYAALILGLLALYQTDPNTRWFTAAMQLAEHIATHFRSPQPGFFDTPDTQETLILRPKGLQDNATPSGNALAATALLQLAAYTGRSDWRNLAEAMLSSIQTSAARYPTAFSQWLCALDFATHPIYEVAIIGDSTDPRTQALGQVLSSHYFPQAVVAISAFPPGLDSPALLHDRPLLDGQPAAYVCQGFVCQQPVNKPEQLLAQLKNNHPPISSPMVM